MTITDWVLAALFLLAIITGWRMGTIGVLGNIGSYVIGYLSARIFSPQITDLLLEVLPSVPFGSQENEKINLFLSLFFKDTGGVLSALINIAVFILLFILVRRLVLWITDLLTDIFGRGLLGQINNAGGSVLSVLLLVVVVLLCADVFFPVLSQLNITDAPSAFLSDSEIFMPLIRYIQYLV